MPDTLAERSARSGAASFIERTSDRLDPWMTRLRNDFLTLERSFESRGGVAIARLMIETILLRIKRFNVRQPYASEWCRLYAHASYIVRHIPPGALKSGSPLLRAAMLRVVQFLRDNEDLAAGLSPSGDYITARRRSVDLSAPRRE